MSGFSAIDNYIALLDNTEDMLWSLDTNLNLTACNKPYRDYMHLLFGEYPVIGKLCIVQEKKPAFCTRILNGYHTALSGQIHTLIDKGIAVNNFEPDILIRFIPIRNGEGEIVGVSCFRRDITEFTTLIDTLKTRNEQLEQIAWVQSHQLRGPLATLMSIADVLQEKFFASATTSALR